MLDPMKGALRRIVSAYCRSGLRGRTRLLDAVWRPLAPAVYVEDHPVGPFRVRLDHRLRACRYMAYGLYERGTLLHMERLLRAGDTVFDVGGNVGYMAAHCGKWVGANGAVHVFEPSAECLPYLEHLIGSDTHGILRLNECAVSSQSRSADFYETEATLTHGFARLDQQPSERFREITHSTVKVVSLDDYIEEHEIRRLDLVKVDVEGHELHVVQGLQRAFGRGIFPIIVMEATRGEFHDDRLQAIHTLLAGIGYSSSIPCGRRLSALSWNELPETFHGNLFWLHQVRHGPTALGA